MLTTKRMFIGLGIFTLSIAATAFIVPMTTATCEPQCRERANGHGTIILPSGARRQFSFSAVGRGDGTANGSAIIHNPDFPAEPQFRGRIEVACLEVRGNTARIAGVVRNTNDPNLDNNTAVFQVVDNGEPGRGDTISRVFFSPPNSPPPTAAYCRTFENFQQNPIESGNIQVNDCP